MPVWQVFVRSGSVVRHWIQSVFMASFHHTWCSGSYTSDFPLTYPLGTSSPQHLRGTVGIALTVHYLPYCAPFPRLSQSLQGDWVLSWLVSEPHPEGEEEAILLGLRKKDMPLEVDFFWGSSDCCWDLSCWLMMIWMSSWGKVGKKRKLAGSLWSSLSDLLYCLQCLIIVAVTFFCHCS